MNEDTLELIFRHCDVRTLARLECVSKSCRDISKRILLDVHVTPACDAMVPWVAQRASRVRRLSCRRLCPGILTEYVNARSIDIAFVRVMEYGFPWRVEHLRVHRLSRPFGAPVVKTLELPDSLQTCDLAFDDTYRCIELRDSKRVRVLKLRGASRRLRQPDVLVAKGALKCVDTLEISTPGRLVVVSPTVTDIRRAALDVEELHDDLWHVLGLFGDSLRNLEVHAPEAGVLFSEFRVRPERLEISADFVCIDVLWPQLRALRVRAKRLASVDIPEGVRASLVVNGRPFT